MTSMQDGPERMGGMDTMADNGARILLVEDDPLSQDLVRALCEGRGARVDTAADGFQGLRLLSERRHDIALIDYHLPEMDGYALARLMREIARPEGRLRLVGVTADRHGLASRRGADTLFDAILVKPLEPERLFATLDRLLRPEPAAARENTLEAGPVHPAEALWCRRGLPGRPRVLVRPEALPVRAVEALTQAFRVTERAEEADVVLVATEAGLPGLHALRGGGAAQLLPSIALDARLEAACDLVFRVGDPSSWTAVAEACHGFAARRAALAPPLREPREAAARLLALLAVSGRGFTLGAAGEARATAYETGLSPAARMAAVLQLTEEGHLACTPSHAGVAVRLTEAGRAAALRDAAPGGTAAPPHVEPRAATRPVPGWCPPSVREEPRPVAGTDLPTRVGEAIVEAEAPVLDTDRTEELVRLIGADTAARLRARLVASLEVGLPPDGAPDALARQAHILIAMAGNLGFDRLSRSCRALETALATGGDACACRRRVERDALQVLQLCAVA